MKRWLLVMGAVGILGIAIIVLTTIVPVSTAEPPAAEQSAQPIEAITYEEIAPYFEALVVAKAGGQLHACGEDNFNKLPQRNPRLEAMARYATTKYFFDAGYLVTPYLKKKIFDKGESPWGAFSLPAIKEKMEPIFEAVKQETIANHEKELAAQKTEARQPS